jgi:hypothetical protein
MNFPSRWIVMAGILIYGSLAVVSIKHPQRSMSGDSPLYLSLAKDLGGQTFRLPGYPLFLRVCGSVRTAIFVQCVIGVGLIFFAWHFFYEIGGAPGALFGTLFLCFEFVVMMHQRVILSESIFLPMLMLAVGFGIRKPLCAAFFFGLLALIHPTGLIAALVFLGICFYKDWKSSLMVGIIVLAFPLSWVYRNYRVIGHPAYASDGGVALFRYPALYLDPTLDEATTPDLGKTAIKTMAKHPFGTIRFFITGAAHLLIGTGIDMLFVRPYTPNGLMAIFKQYPLLWLVQVCLWVWLATGYSLFLIGLMALWNSGHKDQACFLGLSALILLASGSLEGYYRWRIPLMPYLAAGVASCFSLFSPQDK